MNLPHVLPFHIFEMKLHTCFFGPQRPPAISY